MSESPGEFRRRGWRTISGTNAYSHIWFAFVMNWLSERGYVG